MGNKEYKTIQTYAYTQLLIWQKHYKTKLKAQKSEG